MAAPSDAESQEKNSKKNKKLHLFRFGNYNRYYGYRMGREMEEDPRLKCLRREWFEGKDCLDVGCNEGIVTISIAQKYNCNSMLGVDLDRGLIAKAKDNLEAAAAATEDQTNVQKERDSNIAEVQSIVKSGSNRKKRRGNPKESDSITAEGQGIVESGSNRKKRRGNPKENDSNTAQVQSIVKSDSDSQKLRKTPDGTPNVANEGSHSVLHNATALQRVTFKEEQFIDNFPHGDFLQDGTFDTILCLSVTKWVHLNWGDEGLINLFAKIFRILRMGGVFILEPQPWKSYVSKNYVSEITRKTFHEIVLRPDHFKALLLNKIGFKSVSAISEAVPNSTKGFNRALYVYTK